MSNTDTVYIIHTTNENGESTVLGAFSDEDVANGLAEGMTDVGLDGVFITTARVL